MWEELRRRKYMGKETEEFATPNRNKQKMYDLDRRSMDEKKTIKSLTDRRKKNK